MILILCMIILSLLGHTEILRFKLGVNWLKKLLKLFSLNNNNNCLLYFIGFKSHLLTLVMIAKKDLLEWFAELYFLNIVDILMLAMKYYSLDHRLFITVILRHRELGNMCLICVHRYMFTLLKWYFNVFKCQLNNYLKLLLYPHFQILILMHLQK